MAVIRYVCLSDLHLGEEESLLTNLKNAGPDADPSAPSPVMRELVRSLRLLLSPQRQTTKPTLVLNGDILELALTGDNQAFMVFERFLELIMPPGEEIFGEIIYVPGNHDHHLWELARETQYVNYIRGIPPAGDLPPAWHTTNIFLRGNTKEVASYTLTNLLQRFPHLSHMTIKTWYPSFGLSRESDRKCIIFNHGHYVESIYQLMTGLIDLIFPERPHPATTWDIESENFAWIDFFWSTLGRSGNVGRGVERIYEKLQSEKQTENLLNNLARSLAVRHDLPGWGDWMEEKFLAWALRSIARWVYNREKGQTSEPLSEEALTGLRTYLEGPLLAQITSEMGSLPPGETTLLFGHTHKPFEKEFAFAGYETPVSVYNTGGWVVETVEPAPLHGGSIVLIDEDFNTVAVRMYNEQAAEAEYAVSLQEANHRGSRHNSLYTALEPLVKPSLDPWVGFSKIVAKEVAFRAENLRAKIEESV